jgi:hypothetical protein
MISEKRQRNRKGVHTGRRACWLQFRLRSGGEEGQSLLEMTVGLVFLLGIVLILFEAALLFQAYIALLNASREGAVYASIHPTMTVGSPEYQEYEETTRAEALAAGLNTDAANFQIDAPVTPQGTAPLKPIIVRLHYQMINPMQGLILPFLGSLGLFDSVWMSAATEMPIR